MRSATESPMQAPKKEAADKIFPLLFYLCEGRWAGLGYAHP